MRNACLLRHPVGSAQELLLRFDLSLLFLDRVDHRPSPSLSRGVGGLNRRSFAEAAEFSTVNGTESASAVASEDDWPRFNTEKILLSVSNSEEGEPLPDAVLRTEKTVPASAVILAHKAQGAVNEERTRLVRAQSAAMKSLAAEVSESRKTLRQVKSQAAAGQLMVVASK